MVSTPNTRLVDQTCRTTTPLLFGSQLFGSAPSLVVLDRLADSATVRRGSANSSFTLNGPPRMFVPLSALARSTAK